MLNRSGISMTAYGDQAQILANVELQASIGVVVDDALGNVTASGKKIVPAGTPVEVNFSNLTAASGTANAVILHDVDVTAGDANATALIFGFVNKNRVQDATVKASLTAGSKIGDVMILAL